MNLRRYRFGQGEVACSTEDGSPLIVKHPKHRGMSFLLGKDQASWHHSPFFWGKGFLIAKGEAGRWDHPRSIRFDASGVRAEYDLLEGISLKLRRTFGERWTESYQITNHRNKSLEVGSLAISVPFRDVYPSAKLCLKSACHAHIWTGGAYSYVLAIPMNGGGPGLGLSLVKGELWSYSIESRNQFTSSNIRGHIYLHLTDRARSPHAMGGQPRLIVSAGETLNWEWSIGWHEDFPSFEKASSKSKFTVSDLVVPLNSSVTMAVRGQTVKRVLKKEGFHHIDLTGDAGRTRITAFAHSPLKSIVLRRIKTILKDHRSVERAGTRSGAFVPVDTQTHLSVNGGDWWDWSDARERIGMPILFQHAQRLGWNKSSEIQAAVTDYAAFSRAHIVGKDGTVYEDSYHRTPRRLYNFAWWAEFYCNQFTLHGRREDLLLAARIVENYHHRGGFKFLAFWHCNETIIQGLRAVGEKKLAAKIRRLTLAHADYFVALGMDLPRHEVHYEQSVVAPLVLLLNIARRLSPSPKYEKSAAFWMRALLAFGGEQPHARLMHIPIRHWDGMWFGRLRHFGDTMPHYWSVLSAAAIYEHSQLLGGDASLNDVARKIFLGNLVHFRSDGSATCAFIFPSCVNGNPTHIEDPIANDQDWALAWYLKYPKLWPRKNAHGGMK